MAGMIRLGVIDNDKLVPAGVRALLTHADHIDLVHAVQTVDEQLAFGPELDVVLLDLQLGDGSDPAENVARLCATGVQVLVFSVLGDRRHVRSTLRAGAAGYLVKDDDGAKLAEAVTLVHSGERVLTVELMSLIQASPPDLSPQEMQVLYLYGTGSTLAATARRLGVAIPTVRSYLDRIRAKWAAIDDSVDDVRELIHEYLPPPNPRARRR
jgi:DNA-binding NarL/FixJ family response regulator